MPNTIKCVVVWGSPTKRRRDHLDSREDALALRYSQEYDTRKPKVKRKWRWDAGAIHKIRLPRNLASDEQEREHWPKVVAYWQMVAKELKNGGYPMADVRQDL